MNMLKDNLLLGKPLRLIIILSILFVQFSSAQDVSFSASVSKNRVVVGEQFQVSFTLNATGANFNPPDFSNFAVLSGPNQSSSVQIINGSVSQSQTLSYILSAKKEGRLTIGAASIQVGNKVYSSKPFAMEVGKGSPQSAQGNNNNARNNSNAYPEDLESNIFMIASASKSKVYQGEQLLVVFKVYTRLNIVDNALSKAPSFNGFWSEEVPNPTRQSELHAEVLDGIQFQVAEIKKTILIPQRAGTLTIDPLEMEVVTRVKAKSKNNNFFDQFFGGGYQDVKLTIGSKPLKIEVMPLPEKGRPADFNGAVGQLSIEASIKNSELKTDEACNLSYTISGKGNLKLLEAFKLNLPADIETYDPKITDKINVSVDGVKGSRTFDYLLIPRFAGNYTIPPLPFSYFDPQKAQYVTVPGPDFTLKVAKGQGGDGMSITRGAEKEDVKQLGNDIRYIKTNLPIFIHTQNALFGSSFFWILLFIPALLYLGFLLWFQKYKKDHADIIGSRKRKASSMAQKQLKSAAEFLKNNEYNAFFEEVFKAFYGYIGNKLSLSPAELNKEKIKSNLQEKSIDNQTIARVLELLEKCEFARFAPVKDEQKMKEAYDQSVELISQLEAKLKK
jgi:hypothetical protein